MFWVNRGERHHDGEDHGGRTHDGGSDEHRLAVALKVLPAPSFSSSICLATCQEGVKHSRL